MPVSIFNSVSAPCIRSCQNLILSVRISLRTKLFPQFYFKKSTHSISTWVTTLHTFNGHFSGTTRVSQYHKGKTNLDFTEARDSGGSMQVCTSLQTDNHASTPPLSFLEAGCPSCSPTNSVKALKT